MTMANSTSPSLRETPILAKATDAPNNHCKVTQGGNVGVKGNPNRAQRILEAASALTSLRDEKTSPSSNGSVSERASIASTSPSTSPALNDIVNSSTQQQRFPEKLMEILSTDEYCDSITWLPNGKAFAFVNPEKFTNEVLPLYFKKCKYSSFTRKLYRWGFRQNNRGPETESFFHKNFQRDRKDLCNTINCGPQHLQQGRDRQGTESIPDATQTHAYRALMEVNTGSAPRTEPPNRHNDALTKGSNSVPMQQDFIMLDQERRQAALPGSFLRPQGTPFVSNLALSRYLLNNSRNRAMTKQLLADALKIHSNKTNQFSSLPTLASSNSGEFSDPAASIANVAIERAVRALQHSI